jgi:hypothetical protein
MGFKDFFSKEINCARCGKVITKKEAGQYDASHQGKYKEGISQKVCLDCLKELLFENLLRFQDRLVIISPIRNKNAMVTYNFDELLSVKQGNGMMEEQNKQFVYDLRALLPLNTDKCACCGEKATMTYAPSAIINHDPFSWRIIHDESIKTSFLCSDCMTDEMKKVFTEVDILLDFIYPPLSGDGLLCSWEL